MPFVSEKQRKFFNANREKLEAQGVNVDEWNASTKGKKLPKKAPKTAAVLYNVLVLNNLKHAQMMQPIPPPPPVPVQPPGKTPEPAVDTATPPTKPPATMTPGTMTPGASQPSRAPQIASTR
jgi:hypothetical protein